MESRSSTTEKKRISSIEQEMLKEYVPIPKGCAGMLVLLVSALVLLTILGIVAGGIWLFTR